ncbi:MAG TPA: methylmalonyl Co-A mutase-associated GTPase MeaB [Acidimicrobiales bacterium]|nr:methylmalonyl Co-A mutase-associated GTPase MeaB [Acidimicrobiales bacterium]
MARTRDPRALTDAVLDGDRSALPRLLTVVERGGAAAAEVGRRVYPHSGRAYVVGVTGPPGAGKSTLTDRVIGHVREGGREVAVLAVDPSSPFSGGALLGDRVRMVGHALDAGVFVRSLAARGHLGGLSLAVPEVLRVVEAAGFPVVILETVGVGQSEIEVAASADTTVVVVTPGSGDSVQANKAGLFEVADVFVINKADHPATPELERDLRFMLELTTWRDGWRPPIIKTVALRGDGTADVLEAIEQHRAHLESTGQLEQRRAARATNELTRVLQARVERLARDVLAQARYRELVNDVVHHRTDPWTAADEVLRGAVGG